MSATINESFITDIHRLDPKGSGQAVVWRENELGNPKKLKLTIPQTLPGEKVKVTVERPDKRRWRALPDEIIEAHPERVAAPCPHFERCGGCVWQHWQYEGQLKQKTNYVKEVLEAQGFDSSLVKNTIGMDNPWHYRNKMEFTFAKDGSLGLHEQGNFRNVIPLETCLIAGKEMVEAAMEVAKWAKFVMLFTFSTIVSGSIVSSEAMMSFNARTIRLFLLLSNMGRTFSLKKTEISRASTSGAASVTTGERFFLPNIKSETVPSSLRIS